MGFFEFDDDSVAGRRLAWCGHGGHTHDPAREYLFGERIKGEVCVLARLHPSYVDLIEVGGLNLQCIEVTQHEHRLAG